MDLVRRILFAVEEYPGGAGFRPLQGEVASYPVVVAHVELLEEAGLLEAIVSRSGQSGAEDAIVHRLTWAGHEFLDAIRHDTVWARLKERVDEEGGNLPFAVLKTLATKFAAELVGLS